MGTPLSVTGSWKRAGLKESWRHTNQRGSAVFWCRKWTAACCLRHTKLASDRATVLKVSWRHTRYLNGLCLIVFLDINQIWGPDVSSSTKSNGQTGKCVEVWDGYIAQDCLGQSCSCVFYLKPEKLCYLFKNPHLLLFPECFLSFRLVWSFFCVC